MFTGKYFFYSKGLGHSEHIIHMVSMFKLKTIKQFSEFGTPHRAIDDSKSPKKLQRARICLDGVVYIVTISTN